MVESLGYKLLMFGVPIDVYDNIFYDKEAVYNNTITPEYVLDKKNNYITYHRYRESVTANTIRVTKQVTEKNLAGIFTNIMAVARRRLLLEKFTY